MTSPNGNTRFRWPPKVVLILSATVLTLLLSCCICGGIANLVGENPPKATTSGSFESKIAPADSDEVVHAKTSQMTASSTDTALNADGVDRFVTHDITVEVSKKITANWKFSSFDVDGKTWLTFVAEYTGGEPATLGFTAFDKNGVRLGEADQVNFFKLPLYEKTKLKLLLTDFDETRKVKLAAR